MAHEEQLPQEPQRGKFRISPATLIAGVAVLELVIAVFLFWMASVASGAPGNHSQAFVLGGAIAVMAGVVALVLWVGTRSDPARITTAVWVARLLPLIATGVALVAASGGWVPWVAVPLALFAAGPVAVLGMVLPQYLNFARAADAGRSNG
ncbi:hypothetical protein V6K52_08015 [Knoellia sp. S7-12]|uniref:hypothetical protein n=1 Tax=Knoellia sp. S7-12 TaxID=3126698 RepID=UPI003366B9EF